MVFKEGDRVKVKTGLAKWVPYGESETCFIPHMKKYCDKIYTVKTAYPQQGTYILDLLDGHTWLWTKEMLEPVNEPASDAAFRIGDRVETANSNAWLYSKGEQGKVVALDCNLIGIEFGERRKVCNHDCCGAGKRGYCAWITDINLRRIAPTDWIIVISNTSSSKATHRSKTARRWNGRPVRKDSALIITPKY